MSDLLNSDCSIDRKFFSLRQKVNRPKAHHLEWKDDSRLSFKRVKGTVRPLDSFGTRVNGDTYRKIVCDRIAEMASLETGVRREMTLETVFPFLREERERNEKRRLDFLKGLLEIMDREADKP